VQRFAYGPADASATPSSLASLKSRPVQCTVLHRWSRKKAVKWVTDVANFVLTQQFKIYILETVEYTSGEVTSHICGRNAIAIL